MLRRIKDKEGVSLIEVIFAVGLMALVMTGVAGTLITAFGVRTKGYSRKKAAELGQYVMEVIISYKSEDPVSFWDPLNSAFWLSRIGVATTNVEYPQYSYNVSFSQVTGNGCAATPVECATVVVDVGWSGSNNNVIFTRFFTRD